MAAADRIRALVARLAPAPVCDDCIAARLGLEAGHAVAARTRALAGSDGFERKRGVCALCGTTRSVIRRGAAG